jgi:hypothetical protein
MQQSTKKNQKEGRQKEGSVPPRKMSPKKCLRKIKKQQNPPTEETNESPSIALADEFPLHRLSPSIQSRLVRCAGPMLPLAKKVLL